MHEGPNIARVSALVADPARSAILMALMDGRALTASELARQGGVTRQTASSHLAKLVDGEVLSVESQGRHRYFRLSGPHVANLLEALMVFSGDTAAPTRTGPRDHALRKSRICYDHLAGEFGVRLFERMKADDWLGENLDLTPYGWTRLALIGVTPDTVVKGKRPLCRACLDWSERRHHLAGRLGKSVLDGIMARGWARRLPASRVIQFHSGGDRRFSDWIG
jgi:DNA-binding transcriptional ArsR family regulator